MAEKEGQLAAKDDQISALNFELDKFRRYLFGSKSEKYPAPPIDVGQINLFELGTVEGQQEELSLQVEVKAEKKPAKKRAQGTV